jgi:hypothetical protein
MADRFELPPGCYGVDLPDGGRLTARERGGVVETDRPEYQRLLAGSRVLRPAPRRVGFADLPGRRCRRCGWRQLALFGAACTRCGGATAGEEAVHASR